MCEEKGEPRHAYDHGGTAARTLTLHAPLDAHRPGIGSAAARNTSSGGTFRPGRLLADAPDPLHEAEGDDTGTVGATDSGRSRSSVVHW